MKIETIGSAEALLQLFYVAQGTNGYRPNPMDLWREIATYAQQAAAEHTFTYYLTCFSGRPQAISHPTAPFLGDLQELLSQGAIKLLSDGRVEVTAFGKCLAFARTVPNSLARLESNVEKLAIRGA